MSAPLCCKIAVPTRVVRSSSGRNTTRPLNRNQLSFFMQRRTFQVPSSWTSTASRHVAALKHSGSSPLYDGTSCYSRYFSSAHSNPKHEGDAQCAVEAATEPETSERNPTASQNSSQVAFDPSTSASESESSESVTDNNTTFARTSKRSRPRSVRHNFQRLPRRRSAHRSAADGLKRQEAEGAQHGAQNEASIKPPFQRFALALYRKPAFPGFYQVLQVPDQRVFDFLTSFKAKGITEVAGFLAKENKEKELNSSSDATTLRHDAGAVSSFDEVYKTGTLLTILNTVPHRHLQGGQLVIMPHQRVQLLSETPFDGPTEKQMENSVSDAAEDELVMKDSSPDAPLLDHNVPKSPILYTATSVELTTEKQHDNGAQVAEIVESSLELGETTRALRTAVEEFEGNVPRDTSSSPWASDDTSATLVSAKESTEDVTPLSRFEEPYPLLSVMVQPCDTSPQELRYDANETLEALHAEIVTTLHALLKSSFFYKEHFEQVVKYCNLDFPGKLADLVAAMSFAKRDELQAVLEELDIEKRSALVLALGKKDLHFSQIQNEIKQNVEAAIGKDQKKYVLTEQLKYIKQELGLDKDDKHMIIDGFSGVIASKQVSEDVRKVVDHELHRLSILDVSSAEFNVSRTYLEWMTQLPWGVVTEDNKDVERAASILNEEHHGLKDVKERLLEFIAVTILKNDVHGKLLCLVGPPGIGKTSVARSMARALNRQFYHLSLSGLCDVAELRGHRRTYIGALPGKLIQALKYTQTMNPVILLDELDKIGKDIRGDPASALLDILDPTQHHAFRDHYLDVPVDLSRVLFICTANTVDHISGPLVDRMEIIRLPGYVLQEKISIAEYHLIPQIIKQTGVGSEQLTITQDAIKKIAQEYSREAGVRGLLKSLDKIFRKVALQLVRNSLESKTVTAANVIKYLGQPSYSLDRLYPRTPPGVAMGLAWTELGGATLYVECQGFIASSEEDVDNEDENDVLTTDSENRTLASGSQASYNGYYGCNSAHIRASKQQRGGAAGHLKVTGRLGDVMSESCHIAYSFAKSFVASYDPSNRFLDRAQVHLHVPEGATPKDGPSAGITMASALISLALDTPLPPNLAMTGELTLKGKIIRIGGVKEKVVAAQRESVTTLIFPKHNAPDFTELPDYIKEGLTVHFVDTYNDVFALAFPHLPPPAATLVDNETVEVIAPETGTVNSVMSDSPSAEDCENSN